MAIAGGGIPSMPIKLVDGDVRANCFSTNKPSSIVEQDEERAVQRLLNGEMFEMYCGDLQIHRIKQMVKKVLEERVKENNAL